MRRAARAAVLAAAFFLAAGVAAVAELRLDAAIQVPFRSLLTIDPLAGSSGVSAPDFVPLPSVEAAWQLPAGPVDVGIGARVYTLIYESIAWPNVFVEYTLDRFVFRADLGGGVWAFFGWLGNAVVAGPTMMPQLDVSWKLADWFRLGVGAVGIVPLGNLDGSGCAFYVGGRFTFFFFG
ncbi:MAG TPA: hypothetical protein VHE79_02410 [Spirochaetia bacterium]